MFGKKNDNYLLDSEDDGNELDLLSVNKNTDIDLPKINTPSKPIDLKETTIYNDVIIDGNIICHGKLNILGQVNGNVTCDYDLNVEGTINGNIKAGSVTLTKANVTGDIISGSDLNITNESVVLGDVNAKDTVVDGKITGKISCEENLAIQKNANIKGDIDSPSISMLQGAIVDGAVSMNKNK